MRLILASASPRRRELLAQAGFSFEVRAAEIDESLHAGEDAIAYVTRLAREKAQAVCREIVSEASVLSHPGHKNKDVARVGHPDFEGRETENGERALPDSTDGLVVLGADTAVVVDEEILGKPANAADAARMLRLLGGRTHRVVTGVAVVSAAGAETKVEVAAEVTAVRMRALSDEEIAAYIATGEPMDKAGAYAIQGRAAKWIPRIEGCYFNVVGLPVARVSAMLEGRS